MGTDSAGCSWFLLDAPPALDVRDEATGIVATRLYRWGRPAVASATRLLF
jgi:hypothetical protein